MLFNCQGFALNLFARGSKISKISFLISFYVTQGLKTWEDVDGFHVLSLF